MTSELQAADTQATSIQATIAQATEQPLIDFSPLPLETSGVWLPFQRDDDDDIYTYEGWRKYRDRVAPQRPALLPEDDYLFLDMDARHDYDELRRLYTMRFPSITTPDLRQAHDRMWDQLQSNLYSLPDVVKVGAMIDGYAGLGKTVIAKTFARRFERHLLKVARFTTPRDRDEFIPVVHVTLKGQTTPKGLAQSICRFLAIGLRGRPSEQELIDAICVAVKKHKVLLFVIDDIHFLDPKYEHSRDITSHLKALMSLTGKTFLYVGIDCEKMGIFRDPGNNNPLASQTATRFIHQVVRPFAKSDKTWRVLLKSIESHLILLNHTPGTLEKLSAYLFKRTQGNLGSLMNLLQKGAFLAIGGHEQLDRTYLDGVQIDYRASIDEQKDKSDTPTPTGDTDLRKQKKGPDQKGDR